MRHSEHDRLQRSRRQRLNSGGNRRKAGEDLAPEEVANEATSSAQLQGTWFFRTHDYRLTGIELTAISWIGIVLSHIFGLHGAAALFVGINALTWGQGATTFASTENGVEFLVVSASLSTAVLIVIGVLIVEFRMTEDFSVIFIGLGLLSLILQLISYRRLMTEESDQLVQRRDR